MSIKKAKSIGKISRPVKLSGKILLEVTCSMNLTPTAFSAYVRRVLKEDGARAESFAVTVKDFKNIPIKWAQNVNRQYASGSFDWDGNTFIKNGDSNSFSDNWFFERGCGNGLVLSKTGFFTTPAASISSSSRWISANMRRTNPTSFLSTNDTCGGSQLAEIKLVIMLDEDNLVDYGNISNVAVQRLL